MPVLDAYAHVSLPRFMAAEEFLGVMDLHRVERALICTAETGPDLGELLRAARLKPDRFRIVGLQLGEDPETIRASVAAQLAAGFTGIRLHDGLIARQPELLDLIGAAGATPFVVGGDGLAAGAPKLVEFLDQYPACAVFAPHFAGVADLAVLHRPGVEALHAHDRFFVIFSRHSAFDSALLKRWAGALVHRLGWHRILYGSEYPVTLWRDETYDQTLKWLDASGLGHTPADREAFFHVNADRVLFARPTPPVGELDPTWLDPRFRKMAPIALFPPNGLEVTAETQRRLFKAYLAWGGERRGGYRRFVEEFLAGAAAKLPA